MPRAITVSQGPAPYLARMLWPYDQTLGNALKKIPGITWDPKGRTWIAPLDSIRAVETIAEEHGYSLRGALADAQPLSPTETHSPICVRLHAYQRDGIALALRDGARLIAYDPGLGKTATALGALEAAGLPAPWLALVVCPAIAQRVWEGEIAKWSLAAEPIVIRSGKQAAALSLPTEPTIHIVSYELASKLPALAYDAVIADESHYLKSAKSGRSKAVRAIVDRSDPKLLLLLTGTPIMNEPGDLHAQLDLLFPARFGSAWQYLNRYAGRVANEYAECGYTFKGLDSEHADELRSRLAAVCSRVTIDEVRHLLPPLTVQALWLDTAAPEAHRKLTEITARKCAAHRDHEARVATQALKAAEGKIAAACDWGTDAAQNGPAVIFVYRRASAGALVAQLRAADVAAYEITGALSHEARAATIAEWRAVPAGVLVATIDSTGVAIDLTHARQVCIAELHFQPGAIVQALRRCYRLSSPGAVSVTILGIRGTYDDVIVSALTEKMSDIESLQDTSEFDRSVTAALRGPEESDADWAARLATLESGMGDIYG